MQKQIRDIRSNKIIFEGIYPTDKDLVEDAIRQNISLDYADLRYLNLSNANLDGLKLRNADFSFSNFSGSNLSESVVSYCSFTNCNLINSDFTSSEIIFCNFQNSDFGANNVKNASFIDCVFNTVSAFSISYCSLKTLKNNIFNTSQGTSLKFSETPIVVQGINCNPIIIINNTVLNGSKIIRKNINFTFLKQSKN